MKYLGEDISLKYTAAIIVRDDDVHRLIINALNLSKSSSPFEDSPYAFMAVRIEMLSASLLGVICIYQANTSVSIIIMKRLALVFDDEFSYHR